MDERLFEQFSVPADAEPATKILLVIREIQSQRRRIWELERKERLSATLVAQGRATIWAICMLGIVGGSLLSAWPTIKIWLQSALQP